ncbi:MAG: DUF4115 domain-containing protein [Anaerolineales bacterium]|nr:DUF4115 domain-containing protein [Anaerolineales bacterium]
MPTIGQKLKHAREAQRLTFEKVFEGTRIRVQYLQALEADDLSAMPSPVQARGYLRNYAEYLGLNFEQLLEEMRAEKTPADELITPMDLTPAPAPQTPEPIQPQEAPPQPTGKPARRKKADSKPAKDAAPSKPRRTRKKVEPEPVPVVEPQPEVVETTPIAQPEPVVEQPSATQDHGPASSDVSDGLWQSWLNRLSSVISVRVRRKAELPATDSESPQQGEPEVKVAEPESLQTDNSQQSDEIFKEIGRELRERRDLLSLHLDEVERNTKVKAHYLEALENGALENLPSTVQTRGMLSNYASFLDLDVDALLLRYADGLQARHRERNPQKPARQPGEPIVANIPPLRSFIAGDLIFGIGIAVFLVGFLIWGINRVVMLQNQEEIQPTAPSISDVLLATPDPSLFTPTATLGFVEENEPTVTIVIPTQNLNVNVQVNLIAVERTYMRVIVDGEEVFNGRVMPGNAYPFEAEEQVEVLVGSGAAIRIVYNGRDLGLLGGFGEVIGNIYRAEEIVTPTALPTLSPTITPTPTATVPPSRTPIPSKTPGITGTP